MPIDLPPIPQIEQRYEKTDSGLLKPKKNIFMPGMGGPLAGAFLGGYKPAEIMSSAVSTAQSTTSFPITLPSGIIAGDLIIVYTAVFHITADVTLSVTAGSAAWTSGPTGNWSTILRRYHVYYRTATGTDGLELTAGRAAQHVSVAVRISNWSSVEFNTIVKGYTGSADPGSISPSWGGSKETLFLASAGYADSNDIGAPSGYTLVNGDTPAFTINSGHYVFSKNASIASEDPGTMYIGGELRHWAALTTAVLGV